MKKNKNKNNKSLAGKYKPSEPCSCDICVSYCARPGWWTLAGAAKALDAGYGNRMMLEMAPDRSFGVLSPAFRGCEGGFAAKPLGADSVCNFLKDNLCELHGTGCQPLECRVCHHDRPGAGKLCHADLEKQWNSPEGKALVVKWSNIVRLIENLNYFKLNSLQKSN